MTSAIQDVQTREEELRLAMLAGDVGALSELIDDDLVFTGPTGAVMTKEDDLASHRTGLVKVERIELFDSKFYPIADMMLVTTKANIQGSVGGNAISGAFAYTRLWMQTQNGWRVRAGHASTVGAI